MNKLIKVTLKHKNQRKIDDASDYFASLLRASFGSRILGPESPYISRIRNLYYKNILIKIEQSASITSAKNILRVLANKVLVNNLYRSIRIDIDVDPL